MFIKSISNDRCRIKFGMTVSCAKRTEKNLSLFTSHFSREGKRVAFTLAEVLITLGIIGVVAAMTLPSVINNIQNKQLQAGLKKGASEIEQALNLYQAENGDRLKPSDVSSQQLYPILIKYFKTAKKCGISFKKPCVSNFASYKTFNGKHDLGGYYSYFFDDGHFVLTDGSLIFLENHAYLYISIDVNGFNKRPNRLGQDLFMFQITKSGKLLPMGAQGTDYYSKTDLYCSTNGTSGFNGAGCTYKALSEKDFFKNLPK